MTCHARRYTRPLGYRVTFAIQLPLPEGVMVMDVAWAPDVPYIRRPRPRRKFLAAYRAARDSYMQEIAHLIGGAVVIADIDAEGELELITDIHPPSSH